MSLTNVCTLRLTWQIWKIKKLIKSLDTARGAGTSMISLIMPPRVSAWREEKHPSVGQTDHPPQSLKLRK